MTKNEFKKFMENYPVFLDGATGSKSPEDGNAIWCMYRKMDNRK